MISASGTSGRSIVRTFLFLQEADEEEDEDKDEER
jgi:hypothetical protein